MLLIFLIGTIFVSMENKNTNSQSIRRVYVCIVSTILVFQSGLRNVAVGADTYAYFVYFENVKLMSWGEVFSSFFDYYSLAIGKDPGYKIFEKFVQIFVNDYQLYLFVIAIIFFSALGDFIYQNTQLLSEIILAFLIYSALFYAFFSITGHRQTIATAGIFWSYKYLKRKKFIPFILIVLVSSTIHRSCLVFIPFYFLANFFKAKPLFISSVFIMPIMAYFKNSIGLFLAIFSGYTIYGIDSKAGTFTFTIMLLLISLLGLIRMKNNLKYENNKFIYSAFSLAIILTPLTWVNQNMMRIVQYFSIFMLILIPISISSFKVNSLALKKSIYLVAVFSLFLLYMKNSWNHEYKFFWQIMELGENYDHLIKRLKI